MDFDLRALVGDEMSDRLPETPHELPYNRARVDEVMVRARAGEPMNLLSELINCIDWRTAFVDRDGQPITLQASTRLIDYYRRQFAVSGPIYLADLLSTEFMTEQRARGDIVFSDRLLQIGREEPKLWQEIRNFFRRKEFATALLVTSHTLRGVQTNQESEDR
jgi:hypothetical protein